MSLPGFLQSGEMISARDLHIPYSGVPGNNTVGGGSPQGARLPADCERQLQEYWCWAAVAVSVSRFYDSGSSWNQCGIANRHLGLDICCGDAASGPECNLPRKLHEVLDLTGNHVRHHVSAGRAMPPISFTALQGEINDGRIVCTRVGWSDDSGHFLMIVGWKVANDKEYIIVSDPTYLESEILFTDFTSRYQGDGEWNVAYLTAPAPDIPVAGGGPIAVAMNAMANAIPIKGVLAEAFAETKAFRSPNGRSDPSDDTEADSSGMYGG